MRPRADRQTDRQTDKVALVTVIMNVTQRAISWSRLMKPDVGCKE